MLYFHEFALGIVNIVLTKTCSSKMKKTVDIAVLGKSLPLKVTRLDLQKRIHSFTLRLEYSMEFYNITG